MDGLELCDDGLCLSTEEVDVVEETERALEGVEGLVDAVGREEGVEGLAADEERVIGEDGLM